MQNTRIDMRNSPDRDSGFGIPLNVHNVLDYVAGATLILSPYLLGFADIDAARNVFGILGASLIIYSLMTRYRYSLAKVIPLDVHMAMDVMSGIFLMLAPSIFGYRPLLTGFQYGWHFILGLGVVALVALTRTRSETGAKVVSLDDRKDDQDRYRPAA